MPNSENLVDNFTTGAAVYKRYVTKYEPETQTALIVYEYEYDADRMKTWGIEAPVTVGVPYREAMRLHFTGEGNDMLISSMTFEVSSDPFTSDPDNNYLVSSLDDFKLLYANDLGLPDFVSTSDGLTIGSGDPTQAAETLLGHPTQAAETLLGLSPATSQLSGTDIVAPDIIKVTFTFRDNSKVILTMVSLVRAGCRRTGRTAKTPLTAPQLTSRSSTRAACSTRADSISTPSSPPKNSRNSSRSSTI